MEDLCDNQNRCLSCHNILYGRSDKKFCDLKCKNAWHNAINKQNNMACKSFNSLLQRNRIILREFFEESQGTNYVPLIKLYQKGFSPNINAGHVKGSETGEWLTVVYDYAFVIIKETQIKIYYKNGGFHNI